MLQIIARISVFVFLAVGAHFSAQGQELTFEEVPERIVKQPQEMSEEDYARFLEFKAERDRVEFEELLETAREELAELKLREAEWQAAENDVDAKVDATREKLKEKAGEFGELLGQFRLAAGKVEWRIRSSLSSFKYPGRADALRDLSTSRMLPAQADLMTLPKAIIQEMEAQGEVKRFTAEVVHAGTDGRIRAEELIRVGVFQAATVERSEFVIIQKIGKQDDAHRMLLTFPGQDEDMRAAMADLAHSESGEIVRVPIDPTRGRMFIEQVFGPRD